ncbi:MAG: hypothetical protein ACI9YB_002902 [Halioglobus sp.]|jgi:hypothetical protein
MAFVSSSTSFISNTAKDCIVEFSVGKPNPNEAYSEVDVRTRVLQAAQKGNTCWYYALNMIRERFGKDVPQEFQAQRDFESKASLRRKLQTRFSQKHESENQLARQLQEDPHYERFNIKQKEQASIFLADMQRIIQGVDSEAAQRELKMVITLLTPFCSQGTHSTLDSFLQNKHMEDRNRWNTKFLLSTGMDPASFYEKMTPKYSFYMKPWDEYSEVEKAPFLDNFSSLRSIEGYGLKESSWHPSREVDDLIEQIRESGPHKVSGKFGKMFYEEDAALQPRSCGSYNLYAWKKGSTRKELNKTHSIVIIGASKRAPGGLVYFLDPLDESDPAKPFERPVYVMSYNRLKTDIATSLGELLKDESGETIYSDRVGYAFHR